LRIREVLSLIFPPSIEISKFSFSITTGISTTTLGKSSSVMSKSSEDISLIIDGVSSLSKTEIIKSEETVLSSSSLAFIVRV
jgi:hypothetical protein